jgi:hypothetical protein
LANCKRPEGWQTWETIATLCAIALALPVVMHAVVPGLIHGLVHACFPGMQALEVYLLVSRFAVV